MERISAAGNLIIELDTERWRLLADGQGNGGDRLLFEAVHGQPARYVSAFATRRSLPADGVITSDRIDRVVLGWSGKDAAWHLGLVLDQALAESRGSRWCGLASWTNPDAGVFQEVAGYAGESLAQKLSRPFAVVPPATAPAAPMTAPVDTTEVRQPIAQPSLPLTIDAWTLQRIDSSRLELVLSRSWVRGHFVRAGWYIILMGIFTVLSVTSVTSGIALPRPEFLIYFGFAAIFIMAAAALITLIRGIVQPKRIVFDGVAGHVRWLRGSSVVREVPSGQLKEVYVSQVVSKVGKWADKEVRRVRYGELNLLLQDNAFEHVLTQPRVEENVPVTDDPLDEEIITPLTMFNARTPLQSATLAIAEAMRVPATYDKRL